MIYSNLRDFVNTLQQEKDLVIIDAPVDPYLEIAEIHRRVIEEQGPALLFTNVKGTPFPVLTNMFGTSRRVDMAFGPRPEALMKSIVGATKSLMPPTAKALWNERGLIKEALKVGLKTVQRNDAPILSARRTKAPLADLPKVTSWQLDGGPFLTLPLVYTEHPDDHKDHNLGMYRIQIYDDHTTGVHWQIQKGGGFHYHEAEQRGEALPVSVFLGGPPALIASAIAPIPEKLPELLMASLILGDKLKMVEDPYGGHRMPAEAEFVIKGTVPPYERRMEGPFGDHFGYYSLAHEFPILNVERMWHRKDAIYPMTIVGKPRQEDYYLGEFVQRLLSPAYSIVMPTVKDLWAYAESGVHALASAVVRESYSREALVSGFSILGQGQLSLTKFLILTDQMIDLSNFTTLIETVLERFDPQTDLFIFDHTSHDTLDYTGHKLNHGSKAILVGVGEKTRELPRIYEGGHVDEITNIRPYCGGVLLVEGASYEEEPELASRLVSRFASLNQTWPLVILVDNVQDTVKTQMSFLWTVFTRFNPASDMYAETSVKRNHIGFSLPIVIDARMKPGYPEEVIPREDIVKLVDERWKSYFPSV